MKVTWKVCCGSIACLTAFLVLLMYRKQQRVLQVYQTFMSNQIIGNGRGRIKQTFDLRIIVLTYDRFSSLRRLLDSLQNAHYDNDSVILEIWIDRSKSDAVHNNTHQVATDFKFDRGVYEVHVHPKHVGITGQWLTTWRPENSSTEIAVILEDDLTVSPYFYYYLKLAHRKYGQRRDVAGFSLHGESICHGKGGCILSVPSEHTVFLYPTLGTWGFSPNNKNWISFLHWYRVVKANHTKVPFISGHVSTGWYKTLVKTGKADTMWEMEYLYYTRINKEWMLYPNFKGKKGLTFNWLEKGLHYEGNSKRMDKDAAINLLLEWNIQFSDLPDEPVFIDDNGNIVQSYPNSTFMPNTD